MVAGVLISATGGLAIGFVSGLLIGGPIGGFVGAVAGVAIRATLGGAAGGAVGMADNNLSATSVWKYAAQGFSDGMTEGSQEGRWFGLPGRMLGSAWLGGARSILGAFNAVKKDLQ